MAEPMRDLNTMTGKRRVRVWLDAYLDPGDTEKFLLLQDETFDVIVTRRPRGSEVVNGNESTVGDPVARGEHATA